MPARPPLCPVAANHILPIQYTKKVVGINPYENQTSKKLEWISLTWNTSKTPGLKSASNPSYGINRSKNPSPAPYNRYCGSNTSRSRFDHKVNHRYFHSPASISSVNPRKKCIIRLRNIKIRSRQNKYTSTVSNTKNAAPPNHQTFFCFEWQHLSQKNCPVSTPTNTSRPINIPVDFAFPIRNTPSRNIPQKPMRVFAV